VRAGLTAAALLALTLAACSPSAPEGVEKAVLDEAISRAVGDPGTCVILAERGSGKTVYKFGGLVACGRGMPACEGQKTQSVEDLAKAAAADGQARTASCPSTADRSRGVAWAAGPVEGRELVYAAAMEGANTPPGLVIADKLDGAFRRAGLTPPGS
jgi:hypothetical protein